MIHQCVLAAGAGLALLAVIPVGGWRLLGREGAIGFRWLSQGLSPQAEVGADQVVKVGNQNVLLHAVVQGVGEVTLQACEAYHIAPGRAGLTQDAHCVALDLPHRCMEHSEVPAHNLGLRGKDTVWARDQQLLVSLFLMVTMQVVFERCKHFGGELTETTAVRLRSVSHFLSRRFPESNISPRRVIKVLLSWIKAFKVLLKRERKKEIIMQFQKINIELEPYRVTSPCKIYVGKMK